MGIPRCLVEKRREDVKKAINIRFADEEHKKLQELSKILERSMNELVREAVREHLPKLEASATSLTNLSPLPKTHIK